MLAELDSYDWEECFGEGSGGNTTKDIDAHGVSADHCDRENVAEIIAMIDGENDESDWVGLFRMNDGRFLAVVASCDYTGWDCQASNTMTVAATLGEVIRFGLDSRGRDRLALAIESQFPEWNDRMILADYLEEQGDRRCEVLRSPSACN
jgi:hypothetical protein